MKISALILFSALFIAVLGQGSADLKLVDEFDPRQGCETLEMRLDHFFTTITEASGAIGYVVINNGDNPIDSAFVYRKALHYPQIRNFPFGRYAVVLTEGRSDVRVEFWIGRNGKKPEVLPVARPFILPARQLRAPFVEDTIRMVKIDGRSTYITGGNPSCLFLLDPTIAREFIRANPEYDLEFLIKTESAGTYRKFVKLLQNEFMGEGLPLERMRFLYLGIDDEVEGGEAKLASVQTSFVKKRRER